ncbi:CsbD family protein [Caenimonas aquaedulcis]|uniref:CsbD family protein n=1 Tax=Caenimonas aquaedulcis TaxID=2793270 RepID=A0A931H1W9_9BURK|nr:CsbD family protein [Caenimonas aquaedulcis]MBG9387015.1 CsbD family protein [Caenimonas aquaedulcis]
MNKDQVKGRLKEAAGEVQEHVGRVTGNDSQEAKGHAKEQAGKVQKNYGDAKDTVSDAADDIKSDLKSDIRRNDKI